MGWLRDRRRSAQPPQAHLGHESPAAAVLAEARQVWWNGPGGPFGIALLEVIENRYGPDVADAVARADRSIPGAFTESDLSSGSRLIIDQSATR